MKLSKIGKHYFPFAFAFPLECIFNQVWPMYTINALYVKIGVTTKAANIYNKSTSIILHIKNMISYIMLLDDITIGVAVVVTALLVHSYFRIKAHRRLKQKYVD